MADRAPWLAAAEAELRAVARELEVPPARDLTAAVRQRLEERTARTGHAGVPRSSAARRAPVRPRGVPHWPRWPYWRPSRSS